jgi:hypothetical protein
MGIFDILLTKRKDNFVKPKLYLPLFCMNGACIIFVYTKLCHNNTALFIIHRLDELSVLLFLSNNHRKYLMTYIHGWEIDVEVWEGEDPYSEREWHINETREMTLGKYKECHTVPTANNKQYRNIFSSLIMTKSN